MAFRNLLLTNRHFQDLNPLIAGEEYCAPGHRFGPAVRNYVLIHYVIRGRGTLYARDGAHAVGPGQAFLILPGEVTTYEADKTDPWHYRWLGFDGRLSRDFGRLSPVFSLGGLFDPDTDTTEYALAAVLFRLYAQLLSPAPGSDSHVGRVKGYIRANYMQPIRVEELAKQMNLDRRYLSRLFKSQTGVSIQEYLVRVRLEESTRLLRQDRSVRETASLCGYEDVSNYSRMFKRRYGISPAQWKHSANSCAGCK